MGGKSSGKIHLAAFHSLSVGFCCHLEKIRERRGGKVRLLCVPRVWSFSSNEIQVIASSLRREQAEMWKSCFFPLLSGVLVPSSIKQEPVILPVKLQSTAEV